MSSANTRVVDRKVFYAGQTIFRQGEKGDRAYLVQEGAVEILKTGTDGKDKLLAVIGAGSLFGEMALIDDQPRMATARAREQTTTVIVGREQFQEKVRKADPFIRALLNIFVRNIREMARKE
ncbi:MAG: cAMP-binding protein [Rhodospirillaceae bacterium]|nr:MAG: cAMP-binding protein [Rhodospirillaceae bacterium]